MTDSDGKLIDALAERKSQVVLDSGVEEIRSPESAIGEPEFSQEEHRAKTTKLFMILSFSALCGLFVLHFSSIMYLAHDKPNSVDMITRVFETWVPIFSTIVGSAAAFYFTKERK